MELEGPTEREVDGEVLIQWESGGLSEKLQQGDEEVVTCWKVW